mgnify:CR=1 FL=1
MRIAGGEPSVSAADAQGLRGAGAASVTRFAGQDRYTTARIINDAFAATPAEPTMLLTTGSNFPDALSGAVHASLRGVPMYLTTGTCNTAIADMLRGEATQRGITRVIGLGTATTISNASLSLGPCPRTLADEVGDAYGRFAARSYSGSGDRVIDLGAGIPFAQIRASMPSTGMNQIGALDAKVRLYDRLFTVENPDADDEKDFKEFLNPDSLEVLTGCKVEPSFADAKPEDRFQFERTGYFCIDSADQKSPASPDRLVINRIIGLRDSWAKAAKKG